MKITVTQIEKKEVETLHEIEIPSFFKYGWSVYAILSETKYLEARADEMKDYKMSTWDNAGMVESVVSKGTAITAEAFTKILNEASEGVTSIVSKLSMTQFVSGALTLATPEEIENNARELQEMDDRVRLGPRYFRLPPRRLRRY